MTRRIRAITGVNEPILTDIESGASQLLSTAVPAGLSDPFSSAQDGWTNSAQAVDPYIGVAGGDDNINTFTGGQNVDPYTSVIASGGNVNAFTGGQDVNPFTGLLSFSIGGDATTAGSTPGLDAAIDRIIGNQLDAAGQDNYLSAASASSSPGNVYIDGAQRISLQSDALPSTSPAAPADTPQTAPPGPQLEQLSPTQELQLNNAIQQAAGPYDPNLFNTGQPQNIRDVLSGTDWMSFITPSPDPVSDNQPSTISQILSGTYANSVLQMQLSSEGLIPGSFVSPNHPNDYFVTFPSPASSDTIGSTPATAIPLANQPLLGFIHVDTEPMIGAIDAPSCSD